MKSLLFILIGLFITFYFADMESATVLQYIFAPIGVFIFLVCFLLWLVFNANVGGIRFDTFLPMVLCVLIFKGNWYGKRVVRI